MRNIFPPYVEIPLPADDQALAMWQAVRPRGLATGVVTWPMVSSINVGINARIRYKADASDTSQSAEQTEELGTGDCEDFAILKYSTLLQLGIPETSLCLVLAELVALNTAHALLLVGLGEERRVLDNKFDQLIAPADYINLTPIKGFSGSSGFLFARQFSFGDLL